MRRSVPFLLVVLALAGAVSLAILPLSAQTRAKATDVPVIPHEAVPNFFKNPPGIYTGENMGIATNSKGHVFIYHRANETRLFEYTPQGAFVREIGTPQLRLLLRSLGPGRCRRTTSGRWTRAPTCS